MAHGIEMDEPFDPALPGALELLDRQGIEELVGDQDHPPPPRHGIEAGVPAGRVIA